MKIRHMNIHNKDVYSVDYDITRACNNRCPYCCEMDYLDNTQKFNSEVFEKVIEEVNKFKNISVSLLGGDPLVIPEKVKEFSERVNCNLTVFTNLSYAPESKNIQLVKDLPADFINSWHDSSNHDWVKANILILKDKVTPILMIRPENVELMFEHSKWCLENDIKYKVQFIRDELDVVQADLKDPIIQDIYSNSYIDSYNTIDDKRYNEIESLEADLLNIATRHKVICQLFLARITHDGKIQTLCSNPIDYGHINDGLHFKELMCSGNHCLCDTRTYKRIIDVS